MLRIRRPYAPSTAAILAGALIIVSLLFGGASRVDVFAPTVARFMALAVLVWFLLTRPPAQCVADNGARLLLCGILAIPLVQLLPLPWSLWTGMPGRGLAQGVQASLGLKPWLGISLTPDRTLNALLALLPPLAAFLMARRLDERGRAAIIMTLAGLALVSALLGLVQRASGEGSLLYFYAVTNSDSSVGFFSNANHQALFLCCGIVATCFCLAQSLRNSRDWQPAQSLVAFLAIAILAASIVATASRAGVLLVPVAALAGLAMLPIASLGIGPVTKRIGLSLFVVISMLLSVLLLGGQFGDFGLSNSLVEGGRGRMENLPTFWQMFRDHFPYGSGMGSFDPIFRGYESTATLGLAYLNNAHNDYAQIAIEAGLAGVTLIIAFIVWWFRKAAAICADGISATTADRIRWSAVSMTALLLMHSVVDYPLRTAALAAVFAACCALMAKPLASR